MGYEIEGITCTCGKRIDQHSPIRCECGSDIQSFRFRTAGPSLTSTLSAGDIMGAIGVRLEELENAEVEYWKAKHVQSYKVQSNEVHRLRKEVERLKADDRSARIHEMEDEAQDMREMIADQARALRRMRTEAQEAEADHREHVASLEAVIERLERGIRADGGCVLVCGRPVEVFDDGWVSIAVDEAAVRSALSCFPTPMVDEDGDIGGVFFMSIEQAERISGVALEREEREDGVYVRPVRMRTAEEQAQETERMLAALGAELHDPATWPTEGE